MREKLFAAIDESTKLLAQLRSEELAKAFECLCIDLRDCFLAGGKVLICGNGGSHADAMHFAEEWTGRFRAERRPWPVMALGEATHQSCVSNDYGFEHVFARQVTAFANSNDVLIVLSTSGNSPNILSAVEAAKPSGCRIIGLLGGGGGRVAPRCDLAVIVPGDTADRIQELHMLILHTLIEAVEETLPQ